MASLLGRTSRTRITSWIKSHSVALLFLFLIVWISYINTLGNEFISDDIFSIVTNRNITNLGFILTHPIRWGSDFTFYTILKLFGLNPAPFRFVNIVFHTFNVWLIYALLSLFNNKKKIAFFGAAIFAVHPILVESVTWISGGTHVQYTTFFLLSFIFYILSSHSNHRSRQFYIFSVITYAIAFVINNKAMSLPFVFLLYELAFGNIRKNWKRVIPYLVFTVLWGLFFISQLGARYKSFSEPAASGGKSYYNPLLQIPTAFFWYLVLLLFPKDLSFYHSEIKLSIPMYIFALVLITSYLGLIVYTFKKNRYIFFWLVFFMIPLLPTLTPLQISWVVAERYAYLSTLSFAVLVAVLFASFSSHRKYRPAVYGIFSLIVLVYTVRVFLRNMDWQDADHLWVATEKTAPHYHVTHNNLGDMYARHGDMERAAYEFDLATRIKPDYAEAYHNLATIYLGVGRYDLAELNYKKALKYNPMIWQAHQNLGALYLQNKDYKKAELELNQARMMMPDVPSIYHALGELYTAIGDTERAKQSYMMEASLK